ncbi:MAG: ABC transporter ATP-binding protein, partial [Actinobacteria bacterium]
MPAVARGLGGGRFGRLGAEPQRPKQPGKRLVRQIAALFRPYRSRVALVALAIFLNSGLGVVNPLLTKTVFDSALFPHSGHPNLGLLYVLIGLMIGIAIITSAIGVAQTYLAATIGQRVMKDLRDRLYSHLQGMSLRFFTGTRTGEIQSRLQNDVAGVQTVVTDTAS